MYKILTNISYTPKEHAFSIGEIGVVYNFSSHWNGLWAVRIPQNGVDVWQVLGKSLSWDDSMTRFMRPLQSGEVLTITEYGNI